MTVLATAPVQEQHRLDQAGTTRIPGHAEAAALAAHASPVLYASSTTACPPWCSGGHGDEPDGVLFHTAPWRTVEMTCGPEEASASVGVERLDIPGRPVEAAGVRLEGSGPMTPLQALQLAGGLQAAALDALLDTNIDADATAAWARTLLDVTPWRLAARYGLTAAAAIRLKEIVADLLAELDGAR